MDSTIYEIAEQYLAAVVELDPTGSTARGLVADDRRLTDVSPAGSTKMWELNRDTLKLVQETVVVEPSEVVAKQSIVERLQVQVDLFQSGVWLRDLNVLFSPLQGMRMAFDLMAKGDSEEQHRVVERMKAVPAAVEQMLETLELGVSQGYFAPTRQARACMEQARVLAGMESSGYFQGLADGLDRVVGTSVESELKTASASAAMALDRFATYLEQDYLDKTEEVDGVGDDEWLLRCRQFNGVEFDPLETYQWGWEELSRIQGEMSKIAEQIAPGVELKQVFADLDRSSKLVVVGEDNFRTWNQAIIDQTIDQLSGKYFDIPAEIARCEAMLAPPGGAAAMYYTRPSADLKRPGRTWYPTMGKDRFPLWNELTVVFHESVPGHHLQLGYLTYLGSRLNAFQRMLGQTSGLSEGWALYAEQLMDEFGLFPEPEYRLGMLSSQAFRAARVVVDIGLHHRYSIPVGVAHFGGQRWNAELAVEFMIEVTGLGRNFMRSEIDRYLGIPAQATSYKLGQRVWLETRAAAQRSLGAAFDLKDFHTKALGLGFVGLEQLRASF